MVSKRRKGDMIGGHEPRTEDSLQKLKVRKQNVLQRLQKE